MSFEEQENERAFKQEKGTPPRKHFPGVKIFNAYEKGQPFFERMSPGKDLPLVGALDEYRRRRPVRLHVPGHGGKLLEERGHTSAELVTETCSGTRDKFLCSMSVSGRAGAEECPRLDMLWELDVTELEELDDLHNPGGVIAAAQEKAAGLFGARHTFFLVNGTTVGIQALIAASCGENRPLVLPRNAHRCVLGGLVISGARPIFIMPPVVPGFGFAAGFRAEDLDGVLRQNPGAGAVLAVHPNYYGVTGELDVVAAVCRRYNVPLLVDEAHGTHLRFHPALPADALSLGADAVVQSVHKTGGALTQASWLHLGKAGRGHASAGGVAPNKERGHTSFGGMSPIAERGHTSFGGMSPIGGVDRERVAEMLRLLQTSSPSYLLMASLDAARDYLARHGREVLDELLSWIYDAVEKINNLPGLVTLGTGHLDVNGVSGYDPTRLVVCVRRLGITGYEAARWLARKCGIYLELSDAFNIVAVLSLGTRKSDLDLLVKGLAELSRRAEKRAGHRAAVPLPAGPPVPPQVLTPRQAWLAPRRAVPLKKSAGLVSAEPVAVYPPGIIAIYPGEEITTEVVEYLLQVRECGLHSQGAADPKLETIRVVEI